MLGLGNNLMHSTPITGVGSGWLKVEFVSTQTGSAAIGLDDFSSTTAPAAVGSPGDRVEVKYKIWIDNSTGKWDPEGDSDTVDTAIAGLGDSNDFPHTNSILTDQVVEVHEFLFTDQFNTDPDIKLATWAVADDKPQAGAVFYIKDVYVRVNRPGTGLGQAGDYSSDDLYIAIHTSDFTGDDLNACTGSLCYANLDLFNTNGTVNKTLNQSPDDI
jgi:hypothetical protein